MILAEDVVWLHKASHLLLSFLLPRRLNYSTFQPALSLFLVNELKVELLGKDFLWCERGNRRAPLAILSLWLPGWQVWCLFSTRSEGINYRLQMAKWKAQSLDLQSHY